MTTTDLWAYIIVGFAFVYSIKHLIRLMDRQRKVEEYNVWVEQERLRAEQEATAQAQAEAEKAEAESESQPPQPVRGRRRTTQNAA